MVGGTRAVSIDPDSEQSTSDLVLSKATPKATATLPNKGKARRRNRLRQRYG